MDGWMNGWMGRYRTPMSRWKYQFIGDNMYIDGKNTDYIHIQSQRKSGYKRA
jgi:hypothetical protein